ncbi:hypothetical protein BPOR_0071g00140 [Botrytis porri]|uniref:Methyltransferase domain-containing protein n=1 Tax=Botrytis porri TaxID=87229 RepID=A0A4Z1L0F3_9HELO|nr:hypothetical protein BPOR_0071g00140 [Botrytis porri]
MSDIYAENMRRHEVESPISDTSFIPPSSSNSPPSPTIADIGTGTGLFLSRLAPNYPDAILHGFDISPNLYPPPDSLPPQISQSILDINDPPSSSLHKKYDLTHIRLLAAGIKPPRIETHRAESPHASQTRWSHSMGRM